MIYLITFLLLISIGSLILGLIKPSVFSKLLGDWATRKGTTTIFGVASITLLIFMLVSSEEQTETADPNTEVIINRQEQSEQLDVTQEAEVIFDIPSLLDKNISYFTENFGESVNDNPEPTELVIEAEAAETWSKRFEKDGYGISVHYFAEDGVVYYIFFSKARDGLESSPEGTWIAGIDKENSDELLRYGNISKDTDEYYYRFFEYQDRRRGKYTGVEVKKNPYVGFEGGQLCNGYPEC